MEDPELFATYVKLAGESREVITAHVGALTEQLTVIVADGADQGEFAVADLAVAARAVFDATSRFHNPVHAAQWSDPEIDAAFEGVWEHVVEDRRRDHVVRIAGAIEQRRDLESVQEKRSVVGRAALPGVVLKGKARGGLRLREMPKKGEMRLGLDVRGHNPRLSMSFARPGS